ncbi:hypothetical protein [Paenibacillus marinisediminis]
MLSILTNAVFVVALILIYGMLFYRLFIQKTCGYIRENITLMVLAVMISLPLNYGSYINGAINILNAVFITVLIIRIVVSSRKIKSGKL